MDALFRTALLTALICGLGPVVAGAPTTAVIPANPAAGHVGQYATVEGVVAKVFNSKNGNTFLNIGAAYPNQTSTGWIPKDSLLTKDPSLIRTGGKEGQ
jgi:hypothetical protein